MARCLLVAATANEIMPFLETKSNEHVDMDVLVTGVGMVATAFALGRKLQVDRYDFAINVGIAGAISSELSLGELVFVETDVLYELGAEDGSNFLTIDTLGFGKSAFKSIRGGGPYLQEGLKKVSGITVNKVHGDAASISLLRSRSAAATESMEGAAFYYACEQFSLPSIQIRSISNYVEKRNRERWDIDLAVRNLNSWLVKSVNQLGKE